MYPASCTHGLSPGATSTHIVSSYYVRRLRYLSLGRGKRLGREQNPITPQNDPGVQASLIQLTFVSHVTASLSYLELGRHS